LSQSLNDTDVLIHRAADGNVAARNELLQRYRGRLRNMISVRIDDRIARRVDASDVVQETLAVADQRLDAFLKDQPIPYYAWLRSLARDQLIRIYRQHILAQRRSVTREQPWNLAMTDASAMLLSERIAASTLSPSEQLARKEIHARVKQLLSEMAVQDCEIIIMRHLEGLSVKEIAQVLELSESAVKSRHFRALSAIRLILTKE